MAVKSVIAAQGYTVREFTKTPQDLAKTLARIKKIGYEAVQLSTHAAGEPKELARMLNGEGLVCCATHVGFDEAAKEPQRVAEEHAIIGCKHTAIGSAPGMFTGGAPLPRTEAYWSEFAKSCTVVARGLNAVGLTFSFHNHAAEFEKVGKRRIIDVLIEDSEPCFGMELDTYWVHHGGGDPAKYLRRLKGRTPLLHLKDLAVKDNKVIMAEIGEGNLDWPGILAAAKEAGVEWYIVEQDICQRDPFEAIAISLANLRAMGVN
jgi:sugar phosphate isomerase/epimerase